MPNEKRVWTTDEVKSMWPQAAGALRGFQQALEVNADLADWQLGMALQLADVGFQRMTSGGEEITSETLDQIEALLDYTITRANTQFDIPGLASRIRTFDDLWLALSTARKKAGRPTPKLRW